MKIELNDLQEKARQKIILPLDGLVELNDLEKRVETLSPVVGIFKVGKETFTRFGPQVIDMVNHYGSEVFLDLKFYDIGNTLKGAADAACRPGVAMFNVHAASGYKGMRYVGEAVKKSDYDPKVLGVTVLTSFDEASYIHTNMHFLSTFYEYSGYKPFERLDNRLKKFDFYSFFELERLVDSNKNDEIIFKEYKQIKSEFVRIKKDYPILNDLIQEGVKNYARITAKARLDGVVCSATDLGEIKQGLPVEFEYVTPGIKHPLVELSNEQKRVFSPYNAMLAGSTYLVVGRAITDPRTDSQKRQGYKVTEDMQLEAGLHILNDTAKGLR
jgi:orotidine-5'-phosphate decarboxylase